MKVAEYCDICHALLIDPVAYGRRGSKMHAQCAKRSTALGAMVTTEPCHNCGEQKIPGDVCFRCGVGEVISEKA